MSDSPGTRKTALLLVGVAVTMASLSFAAVPFYKWFCQVTGFAGTTSVAIAAPDVVSEKTVLVRFDASLDAGMPWDFKPVQHEMTLKIGETGLAFFEAHNPTNRVVAGTASYNVYPYTAGAYFDKIACFCFEMQVLQPGETVQMPVSFFVDPAILEDPEAKFATEITLSYTFYETELSEDQAALAPAPAGAVN